MTTAEDLLPQAGQQPPARGSGPVALVARRWWDNVRSGEIGAAPILVALALITIFFYSKNPNFVSATNFNNLIIQAAGTATIAFGVVFVLLIGEIDLSVGFVSGLAGITVAEMQLPGSSHQFPGLVAILMAMLVGVAIGAFQGSFVSFLGVPSFVVTLAGSLAWEGLILRELPAGRDRDPEQHGQQRRQLLLLGHGWLDHRRVVSMGYALVVLRGFVDRRRHGVSRGTGWIAIGKVIGLTVLVSLAVYWSNSDPRRGVPLAGVLVVVLLVVWTFVATRTTFGRHVYAVGGNAEAARRAGINVIRIRMIVFMISGAMAALGGVVFASRLRSVDLSAGGGTILLDTIAAAVIGGVSLFGGRGHVRAAVLGSLVIAMIANGTDLVGYSASTQYIITGAILLAAVTLDTLSRRRMTASGR